MIRCMSLASLLLLTCAAAASAEDKGTLVGLDGLSSRTPADWKEQETSSQFRFKVFTLPKVDGDKADGELIIFYFGEGGGGGVEANVTRWKSMFQPPEGKKIDDVTQVAEMKVGNVKATTVDIQGTYLFKAQPFNPNAKAEPRPNHRMLAVVFESPKGPYFIRLTGPEKTIAKHKQGFDEWVKNFK